MKIDLSKDFYVQFKEIVSVKAGSDVFRVELEFITNYPEKNKFLKSYYIFFTREYVDDFLEKQGKTDKDHYVEVALKKAEERFVENNREMPEEDGLCCWLMEHRCQIIQKINSFIYPL